MLLRSLQDQAMRGYLDIITQLGPAIPGGQDTGHRVPMRERIG